MAAVCELCGDGNGVELVVCDVDVEDENEDTEAGTNDEDN